MKSKYKKHSESKAKYVEFEWGVEADGVAPQWRWMRQNATHRPSPATAQSNKPPNWIHSGDDDDAIEISLSLFTAIWPSWLENFITHPINRFLYIILLNGNFHLFHYILIYNNNNNSTHCIHYIFGKYI